MGSDSTLVTPERDMDTVGVVKTILHAEISDGWTVGLELLTSRPLWHQPDRVRRNIGGIQDGTDLLQVLLWTIDHELEGTGIPDRPLLGDRRGLIDRCELCQDFGLDPECLGLEGIAQFRGDVVMDRESEISVWRSVSASESSSVQGWEGPVRLELEVQSLDWGPALSAAHHFLILPEQFRDQFCQGSPVQEGFSAGEDHGSDVGIQLFLDLLQELRDTQAAELLLSHIGFARGLTLSCGVLNPTITITIITITIITIIIGSVIGKTVAAVAVWRSEILRMELSGDVPAHPIHDLFREHPLCGRTKKKRK